MMPCSVTEFCGHDDDDDDDDDVEEQISLWVSTRLHGVALYKTTLFTVGAARILNSLAYTLQRCKVLASSIKESEMLPVHKYIYIYFFFAFREVFN